MAQHALSVCVALHCLVTGGMSRAAQTTAPAYQREQVMRNAVSCVCGFCTQVITQRSRLFGVFMRVGGAYDACMPCLCAGLLSFSYRGQYASTRCPP